MKFSKDYSKFERQIFTSIRKNTRHSRLLGNTGNSIKIQTPTREFRAYIIAKNEIKKYQITGRLAHSDTDCTKAELIAMLEKWYGKDFDDFLLLTFKREGELPKKRDLTSDDEFFEIRVAEYERGLKDAKAPELPEITEEWAGKKAKEIQQLIKDGQDEDLSDPVTDLHYLGLSLDIVDSIINDLRPKNK